MSEHTCLDEKEATQPGKVVVLECGKEEPDSADEIFPEGGTRAWVTVAGAFLLQYGSFGYTNAFGVYQGFVKLSGLLGSNSPFTICNFYSREFLADYSASDIGWIGSIEIFLILSSGIVTGRAFDKGYFHHLMITGGLLHSFSYFMLSLAKPNQYYQVFLAQGLGGGLAVGLMYTPSIAVLSHYFKRKRPLAIGCVVSGTAIGAVVHPIMLNHLLSSLGFANTVRIAAALNSSLILIANFMMKTRLPPNQDTKGLRIPIAEFSRDVPYVFVLLGGILNIFGFSFPVFFLQLFSIKAIGDAKFASYSISIMNGASVVGRILPALVSERAGVLNLLILVEFVMATFLFSLLGMRTVPCMIGFAVTYGIFAGASTTLTPSVLGLLHQLYSILGYTHWFKQPRLQEDVDEIGSRTGLSFALSGACGLVATPIAGVLLTHNYYWWRPIVFSGTAVAVCVAAYTTARYLLVKGRKTQIV